IRRVSANPSNPIRFGENFSTVDLGDLRFGQAEVTNGELDENSVRVLPDNPSQGSQALFAQLRQAMREQSLDSLIVIHGFNVTFQKAVESAANMSDRYAQLSGGIYRPNIFVFSWPSNGELFEYKDDRHDAKASGYAFARGLEKLAGFLRNVENGEPCQQCINLIAHSMGNYVLRHALQEIQKISDSRLMPRIFDNIILAAADEDNDAFEYEHKLARLPELAKHITVYFNTEDQALTISDITKGNPDRLGHSGPQKPHQLPYKVVLVDVSMGVSMFGEHSYHVDDDEVVRDILAVLQGQNLDTFTLRTYVAHANKFVLSQ
ncbi:MAG: alpha/beta hydrolase, partial [Cyanobacteria bacterium J06559_3]